MLVLRRVLVKREDAVTPLSPPGDDGQRQSELAEWTLEEMKALEAGQQRLPGERHSLMERAVRISATLKNKTARDVALRIAWQQQQQQQGPGSGKLGEEEGAQPQTPRSASKKSKREDRSAAGRAAARRDRPGAPGTPPGSGRGAGGPCGPAPEAAIDGGPTGQVAQLLDQNFNIIAQIRENMKWFRVNENTELLIRMRDNTLSILNGMSQSEGVMSQMPPLPVRMNLDLANSFLHKVVGQAPQIQPQVMVQLGQVPMHGGPVQGLPQPVPQMAPAMPAPVALHRPPQHSQPPGASAAPALQQQ